MKKYFLLCLFFVNFMYSQVIETKITCDTINHTNHTIYYSKVDNIPLYVQYDLYPERVQNINTYKGTFRNDPKYYVKNTSIYKNSGFDRGHLFPAEDATFDKITFVESFYYTNVTPQNSSFNRGIWKKLENEVRKLAKKDSLTILSGCDLYSENNTETFQYLKNKIKIPNYYFKIIINNTKNTINIYYIPNRKSYLSLKNYLITIDEFEEKTGILLIM